MSAKIYSLPDEVKEPKMDFANFDNKKWQIQEDKFFNELKAWCQKRNPSENQDYIGETIKFGVADGYAIYMVAALRPLQLIHCPVGDAYQAQDVDLMTAKRVKEKIDGAKRFASYMSTTCNVGEVNDFLAEFAVEGASDDTICIKWHNPIDGIGTKLYNIPTIDSSSEYGMQGQKVYKYLVKSFKLKQH